MADSHSALFRTQAQIKRNADDVSAFISDLNTWRTNVSTSEKEILEKRVAAERTRQAPSTVAAAAKMAGPERAPVRRPAASAAATSSSSASAASSSLLSAAPAQPTNSTFSPGFFEAEKALGNAAFQAGDLPAAVSHYSRCLAARPGDPVALANRALALLNSDLPSLAAADCTAALSAADASTALPTKLRHKLLFRRAGARKAMGDAAGALADVNVVVWADQQSKEALDLRRAVGELQQRQRAAATEAAAAAKGKAAVLAADRLEPAEAADRLRELGIARTRGGGGGGGPGAGADVVWVPVDVVDDEEEATVVYQSDLIASSDSDSDDGDDSGDDGNEENTTAAAVTAPAGAAATVPAAAPVAATALSLLTAHSPVAAAAATAAPAQKSPVALPPASLASAAPAVSAAPAPAASAVGALPAPAKSAAAFVAALELLVGAVARAEASTRAGGEAQAWARWGAYLLSTPAPRKRLPKLLPSVMEAGVVAACLRGLGAVLDRHAAVAVAATDDVAAAAAADAGAVLAATALDFLSGLAAVSRFSLACALMGSADWAATAQTLAALRAALRGTLAAELQAVETLYTQ